MPVRMHWRKKPILNKILPWLNKSAKAIFLSFCKMLQTFLFFMNFRSYLLQFEGNCGMMGGSFDKKRPNDLDHS